MKESECESLSKNEQLPESLTLNIPVHHPMGVKIHQAIHNLSQNDSNVYLRKPSRSELASENEKKKKKKKKRKKESRKGQINKFARSRARQKERVRCSNQFSQGATTKVLGGNPQFITNDVRPVIVHNMG